MSKVWTEKEDEFLRENYCNHTYQELAKTLQCTPQSVRSRLKSLGITKKSSEEYSSTVFEDEYDLDEELEKDKKRNFEDDLFEDFNEFSKNKKNKKNIVKPLFITILSIGGLIFLIKRITSKKQ